MKKTICALLLGSMLSMTASAEMTGLVNGQPTYQVDTGNLLLPVLNVGTSTVTNLVLHLNSGGFSVVSVGSTSSTTTSTGTGAAGAVTATCTATNLTAATLAAVAVGQTEAQVAAAVGCVATTSRGSYRYYYVPGDTSVYIAVDLSGAGSTVSNITAVGVAGAPASTAATAQTTVCTSTNITATNFAQVSKGMTEVQVNTALGCMATTVNGVYRYWYSPSNAGVYIAVALNGANSTVSDVTSVGL